jgi:hypothetical protein
MEPTKRKLSVFAKSKGYELDDLQALAEAEQLHLFARLKPFTARFGDLAGNPILVVDGNGRTVTHTGTRTINKPEYAVLRQHEAAILRADKHVTIRMWIKEGYEEGVRIPILSNEYIFYWLLEPQTIGMDEVFINDDSHTADVLAKAHLLNDPTAAQSAQHGETMSVTNSYAEQTNKSGITKHKIKNRIIELDAEISLEKENATAADDYHSVWNALKEIALNSTRPFTGIIDAEKGLEYTKANGNLDYFSKDALRKRMNTSAR